MVYRVLISIIFIGFLSSCTAGKLYYTKPSGERVLGCDVEFVGLPHVDKFAVEYALSLCAKDALKKGYKLDSEQEYLANLSVDLPSRPCGQAWNHDLAKEEYRTKSISSKQYGYIVAHIDLGLAVVNKCPPVKPL